MATQQASTSSDIQIYSAKVCPFAQRTRMVLLEKDIPFSVTEIDLRQKPDWFLEISPYGKVPLITHGNDTVYESAIINEYLEEVYPQTPLLPSNPGLRAKARIWIDFCNTQFIPTYYKLLMTQEADRQAQLKQKCLDNLLFIEREGLAKLQGGGPYWLGPDLSLVDITYYPFMERFPVAEHYRGIKIPDECTRLRE